MRSPSFPLRLTIRGIGALVCFSMFLPMSAFAEQELSVIAGEPFVFGVETSLDDVRFSWVLTQNETILATQAGKFFEFVFPSADTAELTVTLTGSDGSKEVLNVPLRVDPVVTIAPSRQEFVRAVLRTEPPSVGTDRRVTLPDVGGSLVFHLDESTGAIREYHVDTNTMVDSDGDGDSSNDADNRVHSSFYEGGSFPVSVVPASGETEREVKLRVIGLQGEMSEARATIVFDPYATITPKLIVFPMPDADRDVILLPAEGGVVRFDASGSTGGVRLYALDLDSTRDSDGDGNPENDNDVAGSAFERRGSEIALYLRPRYGERERTVTLIVGDGVGMAKGVSRTIQFEVEGGGGEVGEVGSGLSLVADSTMLRVGQSFTLSVENVPMLGVVYGWDLQSDGEIDTQTDEPTLLLAPDAPGVLPVRVTVFDAAGGVLGSADESFTVRTALAEGEAESPQPAPVGLKELRIDVTTESLHVAFKPVAGEGIDLAALVPTWDFGDEQTSYLLTPNHAYPSAGTYTVRLSLSDMASGREVASARATITLRGAPDAGEPEEPAGGLLSALFGAVMFVFKIALFVFFLLLVMSGILLAVASVLARREKQTLKVYLITNWKKIRGEHVEEESVTEIIEAASVPVEEKTVEPPPMKIEKEAVEVVEGTEGAEVKAVAGGAGPPAHGEKKEEALPPWLTETQEASSSPLPAPRSQPAPPAPISEPPVSDAPAPEWLKQGIEKAREEGQTQETPSPTDLASDTPEVPAPPSQPSSPSQPSEDDEPIATVRAELPEGDAPISPSAPPAQTP